MMLALGPEKETGSPQVTIREDDGGSDGDGGGGRDHEEGATAGSTQEKTALHGLRWKRARFSGESVRVSTPYVGSLRYCVVAIVERMGSILDDDGEFEQTSSPPEMTSVVVSVAEEMHKR